MKMQQALYGRAAAKDDAYFVNDAPMRAAHWGRRNVPSTSRAPEGPVSVINQQSCSGFWLAQLLQFFNECRAHGTRPEVILLFGSAGVRSLFQASLQLNASHTALPKPLLHQCTVASASCSSCASTKGYGCTSLRWFLCSGLFGLFGSSHLEQVAQFHARFMQL